MGCFKDTPKWSHLMKQNLQAKSLASTRYRLSLKNFKNAFPLSAVFDSATAF